MRERERGGERGEKIKGNKEKGEKEAREEREIRVWERERERGGKGWKNKRE